MRTEKELLSKIISNPEFCIWDRKHTIYVFNYFNLCLFQIGIEIEYKPGGENWMITFYNLKWWHFGKAMRIEKAMQYIRYRALPGNNIKYNVRIKLPFNVKE